MTDEALPPPEEIVLYDKDPRTKIATITLNRPERHNAPTIASRHRFAELVHRANVDDEVKVLVLRGAGKHFGTGADLPEMAGMFSDTPSKSLLHEFKIGDDEGVKYPPKDSYRYLASLTQLYANPNSGCEAFRISRRSASSRRRAIATAGIFIRRPTRIWSSHRTTRCSATPLSATPAGRRVNGNGP